MISTHREEYPLPLHIAAAGAGEEDDAVLGFHGNTIHEWYFHSPFQLRYIVRKNSRLHFSPEKKIHHWRHHFKVRIIISKGK